VHTWLLLILFKRSNGEDVKLGILRVIIRMQKQMFNIRLVLYKPTFSTKDCKDN